MGFVAAVPGLAVGLLVGGVVGIGIGALYGWYKSNQIDKQIAEEKRGYLRVEEKQSGGGPTEPILKSIHTPLGGVFHKKQVLIEPKSERSRINPEL